MLVVIVDDDATNLRVYGRILSSIPGVTERGFTSSAEALEWCASNEPDLLLLDYWMPPPDGLVFIERYRALRPTSETPIVMITADQERDIRRRAFDLGAADFLMKPVDPIEFVARVRNLLALRQSRKALAEYAETLAEQVVRATLEIVEREEETIYRLMRAAEFRDNETGMHIQRMGQYAALVGLELGLPEADRRMLLLATPMHDIGKVAMPDHLMLKPGPLTDEEWEIVRGHTRAGYALLRDSTSLVLRAAAEIALYHHERWDGTGYPCALSRDEIPLMARIAAVCDVFDALVSERAYKAPWTTDAAFDAIAAGAETHFDPTVAAAFAACRPGIERIVQRLADQSSAV